MGVGFSNKMGYDADATMADVYASAWGRDIAYADSLQDSNKGETGAIGVQTSSLFNAKYGPYLQNLKYIGKNTLAILGESPYRLGMWFQTGLSIDENSTSGAILGAYLGRPTMGEYMPIEILPKLMHKEQSMEIGYQAISNKGVGDLTTWEQFFALEGQTWLHSMNNDLLRTCEDDRFTGVGANPVGGTGATSTEYVGLESIDRIISNYTEGGFVCADGEADNNTPWATKTALIVGDNTNLRKFRNPGATDAIEDSGFNAYVDHNYTAANTATLRALTVSMIDKMILSCMPYWKLNETAGKVMVTGYDTMQQISTILGTNQRFIGYVGAQVDMNGVKTVPGRDTGFMVSTYMGVPIFPDLSVNRGFGKGTASVDSLGIPHLSYADSRKTGAGNIYLMDTNFLTLGVNIPTSVAITENPLMAGSFNKVCSMYTQAETQVKEGTGMFKGLGKILHLSA